MVWCDVVWCVVVWCGVLVIGHSVWCSGRVVWFLVIWWGGLMVLVAFSGWFHCGDFGGLFVKGEEKYPVVME